MVDLIYLLIYHYDQKKLGFKSILVPFNLFILLIRFIYFLLIYLVIFFILSKLVLIKLSGYFLLGYFLTYFLFLKILPNNFLIFINSLCAPCQKYLLTYVLVFQIHFKRCTNFSYNYDKLPFYFF